MFWTLENVFYLLGIIFLVVMLIAMIASLIGVMLAIRKAKHFQQELQVRLAQKQNTTVGQLFKTVLPLVISVGLGGGYKSIWQKFRR